MSLPTLADLKTELNVTSTTNDDELTTKLDQAVGVVEGLIGPVATRDVSETHYDLWSSRGILLRAHPVVDVVSLTERTSSSGTFDTVAADDYELTSLGSVRTMNGRWLSGDVTVTYTVGREDVPADIAGAIVIVAAHLWETQRGTSPSALALQQQDVDPSFTPGASYAIPNRARELLASYIRPSIA